MFYLAAGMWIIGILVKYLTSKVGEKVLTVLSPSIAVSSLFITALMCVNHLFIFAIISFFGGLFLSGLILWEIVERKLMVDQPGSVAETPA